MLAGSASSSTSKKPAGLTHTPAVIRAICARKRLISVPGKGGYPGTAASKSPVKYRLI